MEGSFDQVEKKGREEKLVSCCVETKNILYFEGPKVSKKQEGCQNSFHSPYTASKSFMNITVPTCKVYSK